MGEILNRTGSDIEASDLGFPLDLSGVCGSTFGIIGTIVITGFGMPLMLIVIFAVGITLTIVAKKY